MLFTILLKKTPKAQAENRSSGAAVGCYSAWRAALLMPWLKYLLRHASF